MSKSVVRKSSSCRRSGKNFARGSAAAFAVGVFLAGPVAVGVAHADSGDPDGSSVSASAGHSAASAQKSRGSARGERLPRTDRGATGAVRNSVTPAPRPSAAADTGEFAPIARVADALGTPAARESSVPSAVRAGQPFSFAPAPRRDRSVGLPQTNVSSTRIVARASAVRVVTGEGPLPVQSSAEATDSEVPNSFQARISSPAEAPAVVAEYAAATATAAPAGNSLNAVAVRVLDSVADLLTTLPAPLSEFLSGALLLVRRALFNQVPVATQAQFFSLDGGSVSGLIDAVDPEGDALTYAVTTAPVNGSVQLDADGSFTYNSGDPSGGEDTFSVTVSDRGFNLLDPFSDRSTEVQVVIGPESPFVGASQGFEIVNLTNDVLWLADSRWISKYGNSTYQGATDEAITTCKNQNFCLTKVEGKKDLRGTALAPGESLSFEISTPLPFFNPSFDGQWVMMEFRGADEEHWLVQVTPTYSNSTNKIEGRWDPFGSQQFLRDDGQPWVLDQNKSTRIFLINSSAAAGGGGVYGIESDASWSVTPPVSCPTCKTVWTTSDREFVAPTPFEVFNNFIATSERFGQRKYTNIVYSGISEVRATSTTLNDVDQPLRIINLSGSAGNSATYKWTVTSDPGPQPQSPWWQKYAAQGAGELAKFLLSKWIGDGIADAAKTAIGSALSPAEVKTGTTTQGSTTLNPRPYSLSVLLTAAPKYNVSGDVVFTFAGCRDNKCSDTGYSFTAMDFQIVDRRGVYNAEFRTVPYQQTVNQGFELIDAMTKNPLPTYRSGSTDNLLQLSAFKGGGSDGSVPEDFSATGCSAGVTSNCTTFTVDNPAVAEIVIKSGRAVLNAKSLGETVVTATYNWEVPKGGVDTAGNPALRS